MMSVQACSIASARSASRRPSSRLVRAAASFTAARPRTRYMFVDSGWPVMGKFSTARRVCTPQYAAAGTSRSPEEVVFGTGVRGGIGNGGHGVLTGLR